MDNKSKIYVAGANGMVGSAIIRKLKKEGIPEENIFGGPSGALDLRNQYLTKGYFQQHQFDYVFLAAAKVGGIYANTEYSAEFIYDNLMIQSNVINSSWETGVKKLLFLGSSCIYPKYANQPITEDQLLSGHLEPSNEAYAISKIAGLKMCQAYRKQYGFNAISLMPTNLYGPNDNFDAETGHVIPSLVTKFFNAILHNNFERNNRDLEVWGDGTALREFLYVDDLADACYLCMKEYDDSEIINVGTGSDVSIKELVETMADILKLDGFDGEIIWKTNMPNGTPRKVLNIDKIKSLGWSPKYNLEEGLKNLIDWYKKNYYGHLSS